MRDLSRFCLSSLTFLIVFLVLYFSKCIIEVRKGNYQKTVPGREIYNAISKSKKKTNIKKLIIGDSTGNQFFNNFVEEDSFYSLACNQSIGLCGHFFLLDDFLKKGNRPENVYMVFSPFSFANNLDQVYTFHYFLKPFYNKDYQNRMSETVFKQIKKIPYYRWSQFPPIKKSIWSPNYKPQNQFQLISPISNEYLLKIDSLQYEYGFDLYLIPSFVTKSKKTQIAQFSDNNLGEVDVRLRPSFQKFIGNITFVDDSCFRDGIHLKQPLLYKKNIVEKTKEDSFVFKTR